MLESLYNDFEDISLAYFWSLLGVIIDMSLNFKKCIDKLCRMAKYMLPAMGSIRKLFTVERAKILGNAFIDSQFNYAP